MYRNNNFSKSTKRRRLLDEQNLHRHLFETDNVSTNEMSQHNINSSDSIDITTNVVVSNLNQSSSEKKAPLCSLRDNNFYFDLSEESKSYYSSSSEDNESVSLHHPTIISELANWAVSHNVPNNVFSNLLKILKKHECFNDFPVDARTIFNKSLGISCNQVVDVKTVLPGIYYHFGILNGIKKYVDKNFSCDTIKLVIGVDGLPLTKSSNSTLWPILGYMRQKNSVVFPIGIQGVPA